MKNTEVRALSDDELIEKIKGTRAELFNLRFQLATGQLDNTGRVAVVKKDIARLHTELRARELSAQSEAAAS
ncbi:MAG TPA: 50S ribosomal protein L29 [Coriobacteriia bacterium]|nr:50S ribosomal protein L29 [Coriobacteriia bacterium]